jgi:hypothetical protein
MSGLRLGMHERLRARIPTTPETVTERHGAAGMRTGRVSMNERGCPCADHATASADRNHSCKIRARYPPVFPTRGEALLCHSHRHQCDQEGGLDAQGAAS